MTDIKNNSAGKQKDEQTPSDEPNMYRWMGFGFELVGVLAIFTYLGHLADEKLSHRVPWLTVVGFFAALVGMMYLLFKEAGVFRK